MRQVFTEIGKYKGTVIAIKKINKRGVDLTRNVRKELKAMRDLRHDNINPFIGANADPGNVYVFTEYCTRGSLQDILANEDVKLDQIMIASLVFDIIKVYIKLQIISNILSQLQSYTLCSNIFIYKAIYYISCIYKFVYWRNTSNEYTVYNIQ